MNPHARNLVLSLAVLCSCSVASADIFGGAPEDLRKDLLDTSISPWGMRIFAARRPDGSMIVGGTTRVDTDTSINQNGGESDGSESQSFLLAYDDFGFEDVHELGFRMSQAFNRGKPQTSSAEKILALTVDAKGRTLVMRAIGYGMIPQRYLADGSLDQSFQFDPAHTFRGFNFPIDWAPMLVSLPDGGIMIASNLGSGIDAKPTILKIKENGSPDTSFGSNGALEISLPANTYVELCGAAIVNGRILALLHDPDGPNWVTALGLDGKPISGMSHVKMPEDFHPDEFTQFLGRQDGSVLIASGFGVVALGSDGALVPGFGKAGVSSLMKGETVTWMGEFPGKGVLIATHADGSCFFQRLKPDGTRAPLSEVPISKWDEPSDEHSEHCGGLTALSGARSDELHIFELEILPDPLGIYLEPHVVQFN